MLHNLTAYARKKETTSRLVRVETKLRIDPHIATIACNWRNIFVPSSWLQLQEKEN